MRRGDVVTVALQGDYGKPRPAVIVQADAFGHTASIIVCPMTTTLEAAPLLRVRLEPTTQNSLHRPSDVMLDKITSVPREKIGAVVGHVGDRVAAELAQRLGALLAVY